MPRIEAAARSHPGRVRENNEDNFYLNGVFMRAHERNAGGLYKNRSEDKRQVYAVCDGMGGMENGETASLMAVTGLSRLRDCGSRGLQKNLSAYVNEISDALLSLPGTDQTAGCTLALVHIDGAYARVGHIGDSRVYFKSTGATLAPATIDHSQAEWYAQKGVLTVQEAEVHRSRNILRRFIGAPVPEGREVDVSDRRRISGGDVYLICSDGLSNLVSLQEMDAETSAQRSCSDACKALVAMALERGGDDNITVVMIRAM